MRLLLSSAVAGSRIRAVIASAQTTLASITTQSIVPPAEIFTVRLAVFDANSPDDGPPLPWDVKWADIDDRRRHIPKNSTADLRLCRIETQQDDKTRRAIRARFFTPTEELGVTLSLAEAWNAQDIFIGFRMVIPEIQIRVSAEGVQKTTDRLVALTLNDQLVPHVYKVEVVPEE